MRLASLNVQCGGFNGYDHDSTYPERMGLIKDAVHALDADTVGLVDTYRWAEVFGDDGVQKEFAELGYTDARTIDLGDTVLKGKLGVTILSKEPLQHVRTIDMAGRSALAAEVSMGDETLGFVSAYLDYATEQARVRQAHSLVGSLDLTRPTVIAGDMNAVKRGWPGASLATFGREATMSLITAMPKTHKLHKEIAAMGDGQTVRIFEDAGLVDADVLRRPTLHIRGLGLLALDHAFYTPKLVRVTNVKVPHGKVFRRATDHFSITFEAEPLASAA